MVDVGEDAGVFGAAFEGDECGFAEFAEALGSAPDFDLGGDAEFLGEVGEVAVSFGGLEEVEIGAVGGSDRGRRYAFAADLGDEIHIAFHLFEAFFSGVVVVDDPGGETDGVFDGEAVIADGFFEVGEFTAGFGVVFDVADPGFDGVVACFGGDFDLLDEVESLTGDGAGVEAVAEHDVSFLRDGMGLGLAPGGGQGGAEGCAACGQKRSPGDVLVHGVTLVSFRVCCDGCLQGRGTKIAGFGEESSVWRGFV